MDAEWPGRSCTSPGRGERRLPGRYSAGAGRRAGPAGWFRCRMSVLEIRRSLASYRQARASPGRLRSRCAGPRWGLLLRPGAHLLRARYVEQEASASVIRANDHVVIHGLLQTEEYAARCAAASEAPR